MENAADFYAGVTQQNIQRDQALKDEFRKQKISQSMVASNNIHKQIALMLNPDTMQPLPGKEQQVAQLRNQLGQVDSYIKQLYNPNFSPESGTIPENPLHKLTDKLHLTKAPDTQGAAKQSAQAGETVSQFADSTLTDEALKRKNVEQNIESARTLLKKYGASDKTIQDVTEGMLGVKPQADKPQKYFGQMTETTDAQGKKHYFRVPQDGGDPEEVNFPEGQTVTPKGAQRPKSQYDQQKEEFAKSLGKSPQELTWKEEQEFIKKRNPFGDARLGIAYQMLQISKANQELKQNQSDFTAFLQLQKQFTSLQKIQTAASNADDYVNNPSGPGDVALVFAFIEATKPSAGFRFTETERKWIVGTRGLVDAAMTKINQGFTGETLAPEQRDQIARIIKAAGSQVQKESNKLLQGAAQFKPKAAAAASNEINNSGTKRKVSLKKAMSISQNKGKSEEEVRKDIEAHGYEVTE